MSFATLLLDLRNARVSETLAVPATAAVKSAVGSTAMQIVVLIVLVSITSKRRKISMQFSERRR